MKYSGPLPPSPYRPFFRRFTDERAADLAETSALYASVTNRFDASAWAHPDAIDRVNGLIAEIVCDEIPVGNADLAADLDRCTKGILALEKTIFERPHIESWHLSIKEQLDLRRHLRAQEHFLANDNRVSEMLATAIINITVGLLSALPSMPEKAAFSVPLHTRIDLNDIVDRIIGTLTTEAHADAGLFAELSDRIYRNICAVSGVVPYAEQRRPFVTSADSPLRGEELLEAYLGGTPLHDLLLTPVPFSIPTEKFAEHAAIFAPTGHGKTRLLEHMIVDFLKSDDPPPMFIMDSMGAMLKKIERLEIARDRLVILDPTDEMPPALNFFQLKGGSKAQRGGLFFYLFKAIDQGLTQRQATMVTYLVELMQQIPGATLDTLRQVCESKVFAYGDVLPALDPIARDFFTNQFMSKDALVNQTKQQIAQRLYTVGRDHTFNRMFNAPENKFNAYQCIQERKIVLINTDRDNLGDEASAIFGRFLIAQVMAAALGRAKLPERDRHLALLVIDEVKAYADEQIETILADARQFGLGLIMATQAPYQLTENVRNEVFGNTAIRFGGNFDDDALANYLASKMRGSKELIQSTRKVDYEYTEFATYVRGLTPQAIKLCIPFTTLSSEPPISNVEHQAMRARNRERYGAKIITHEAASISDGSRVVAPPAPALADVPQVSHNEVKPQPKQTPLKPAAHLPRESGDIELDKDH